VGNRAEGEVGEANVGTQGDDGSLVGVGEGGYERKAP